MEIINILKKIKKIIIFLKNKIKNFIRLIYNKIPYYKKIEFNSSVKIRSSMETIKAIEYMLDHKKRGAFIRFGDGEINILNQKKDSARDQILTNSLAKEMKESISLTGDGIIKGLMIHSDKFGLEKEMKPGVHKMSDSNAEQLLKDCFQYFIGNIIYSHPTLHYLIVYKPDVAIAFFKKLKKLNPIFVGGDQNSYSVIKKLFGETTFIKTPQKNTYSAIDEIENKLINSVKQRNKEYEVVVLACGASSKVLIKRILKKYSKQIFLLDIGSVIDLFHGRTIWTWARLANKPQEYWSKLLEKISNNNL